MIYSNKPEADDIFILVAEDALLESSFFEEIDRWKTHNQNHDISKFKSDAVSDEEYERIKSLIITMRETEDYSEYKKAFDKFCYFCHVMSRGVIIRKYSLTRGKTKDHNTLYVEYAYNTKKMTLPEGTILYHMSKVDGITELRPAFKGKSAKGYLYDKPRIYFTIRKNMPKFLADYKFTEKMHMYVCKEPIKQVYVDPLVWSNIQGAVYVETNKPIKVEKLERKSIMDLLKKSSGEKREKEVISNEASIEDDEFNSENFLEFVTEMGFEIISE